METTTLTASEALLALSTSPHITEVMRTAINNILREHAELLVTLHKITVITDEDVGTFRKRGGTYRGLVGLIANAAIAKAEGR